MSTEEKKFDIFLSYQWNIQDKVKSLYEFLTKKQNFKVWMDIMEMPGGEVLHSELIKGITNSKVVVSCITVDYAKSQNCENELCFTYDSKIPLIVLMFENAPLSELGGVGFKIARLNRVNLFQDDDVTENWSGAYADQMVRAIQASLGKDSKKPEAQSNPTEDVSSAESDID